MMTYIFVVKSAISGNINNDYLFNYTDQSCYSPQVHAVPLL